MQQVGAFDAKNHLSRLLDEAESGKEFLITKHGRPVAKLVPIAPVFDREKARAAAKKLLKATKLVKLRGLKIVNDGRSRIRVR